MSTQDRDEELLRQASALLRESADNLDAHVLSRLNQARHRALEAHDKPRIAWLDWLRPAPAFGAAAVAALAAVLWIGTPVQVAQPPANGFEDIEIVLAEDQLEMYEDLEFYAWLDVQPDIG